MYRAWEAIGAGSPIWPAGAPLLVACWQRFSRQPAAQISEPILVPKSGQTWFPLLNKRWPPRVARAASNSLGRRSILGTGSRFYIFASAFHWRCELIRGRLDGLVLVLGPPPERKRETHGRNWGAPTASKRASAAGANARAAHNHVDPPVDLTSKNWGPLLAPHFKGPTFGAPLWIPLSDPRWSLFLFRRWPEFRGQVRLIGI